MFLKLDGVNGESKDQTHKQDIDTLSRYAHWLLPPPIVRVGL
jgi:type VI protein secretion system component Hcp